MERNQNQSSPSGSEDEPTFNSEDELAFKEVGGSGTMGGRTIGSGAMGDHTIGSGMGLDSDMSNTADTGSRDQPMMSGYETGTVRGIDTPTSGAAMGNTGSPGAGMSSSTGRMNTHLNVKDDEDPTAGRS